MLISNEGFQSTQVYKGIELIRKAKKEDHRIIVAFTGNMVSSGIRKYIRDLAQKKLIDVLITNGAGVEEDLIKTFGQYSVTSFDSQAKDLKQKKIYRIGNLGVKYSLYDLLEEFLEINYEKAIQNHDCDQTPGSIAKILGYITGSEESYLYWCYTNKIELFCPTFHDGAIGDFLMEYRTKKTSYRIDYLLENVRLTKTLNSYKKCGIIILGGGTSKHFALNNSILRGGYDWSIFITTAIPYDGSDSGGNFEEAKSWYKLQSDAECVHIFSEATLVLPFIVKEGFRIDY